MPRYNNNNNNSSSLKPLYTTVCVFHLVRGSSVVHRASYEHTDVVYIYYINYICMHVYIIWMHIDRYKYISTDIFKYEQIWMHCNKYQQICIYICWYVLIINTYQQISIYISTNIYIQIWTNMNASQLISTNINTYQRISININTAFRSCQGRSFATTLPGLVTASEVHVWSYMLYIFSNGQGTNEPIATRHSYVYIIYNI